MNGASRPGPLRFRRDLITRRLEMGRNMVWVLKDPTSRDIQHVNEEDHAILSLIDGRRSVQEIYHACSRQFANRFLSPEALVRFLAEAKRRRLVVDTGVCEAAESPATSRPHDALSSAGRRWRQLVAIRFPGIQPDRFLDALDPVIRSFLSPITIAIYLLLLASAATIAIIHLDEIHNLATVAVANRGAHTVVQLAVVISLVKIIHELAHAITCKAFGVDCRELGIMLLLGIPCLYCDVSDAWLLPQRVKRILVSAAGMIAELGIAALATLLWLCTSDPGLQEWCLVVMVVCSISTVVVNGNPLMRYDGYFIFSDLVGVPNLSANASMALRRIGRWLVWSEPLSTLDSLVDRNRWWLAGYAVLSGMFRLLVVSAFAWGVYRFTFDSGVAIFGVAVAAILAMGTISPGVQALLKPPSRLFRSQSPLRTPFVQAGFGVAMAGMFMIPLPQSVVVPMTVRPADSQELYLPVGGRLIDALEEESVVRAGTTIAVLQNVRLQAHLLEAEVQYERLETEERNLAKRRSADPGVATRILATIVAKRAAAERIESLRTESNQLTLTAPRDGMVFRPTAQVAGPSQHGEPVFWTGSPLDPCNAGAWLEPATMICVVGDPTRREAILMVEQNSVSLIESGQSVHLLVPGAHGQVWSGEVLEVGATPVIDCPAELLTSGMIATAISRDESSAKIPRDTLYQVRVGLCNPAAPVSALTSLPIRTIGHARVAVDPESLWSRIGRLFFQSFRF